MATTIRSLLELMRTRGVFKIDENEGFILKSGMKSPIYIDLRESFGYAEVLESACDNLVHLIESVNASYDGIVGVPYAALPYSTIVALHLRKPLIIIRKEAKSYGTKKLIEGRYEKGQTVIIIEDVVTTGGSIRDVVKVLRDDGLIVKDVFCLLDRQQGGSEKLKEDGIQLHSLMNMELILSFLLESKSINEAQLEQIKAALTLTFEKLPSVTDAIRQLSQSCQRLPLAQRLAQCQNPLNKKIFNFMLKKKSNLCLAIDYKSGLDILKLTEKAGPYIVAVKLHIDVVNDFNQAFINQMISYAQEYEFVIFEDRKFADIGNVINLQLEGTFNISKWADVVTCHSVQGAESIVKTFNEHVKDADSRLSGVLLIAELSSKGALTTLDYKTRTIAVGEENPHVVSGFICQNKATSKPGLLNWTPGVNLDKSSDGSGQQWRTIEQAIIEQQNDIVIVGRAITESADPCAELQRYRVAAWKALTGEAE